MNYKEWKDPAMQRIFEKVSVVATSEATVLIEGATGTGKDLLANVIHSASNRADKVLVKVNCAALPDNLLESELFGYVKGAFTGADKDKPIEGLVIMKGLEKDGDEYNGGKILDPKNGKYYKCYITLEEANKLKLRGYIGCSLVGRTEYWYRVDGK